MYHGDDVVDRGGTRRVDTERGVEVCNWNACAKSVYYIHITYYRVYTYIYMRYCSCYSLLRSINIMITFATRNCTA